MTSLLLHVLDEEMRVDDPHGWKTLRLVQREQRRATEPAIYPQNEITNSISHTQTPSLPSTNIIQSTSHLSFKNLNPEVICMILSYLFGDCIENTAKASKTVRDALMTKYTMHEQLSQMWSVNTGGNAIIGTEASHPLDILEVFLRNPRVAPNLEMYPTLLQLEGCDEREHFDNTLLGQQISEHTRRLAKLLYRDITTAVEASPRLSSQEQHEWSHQICSYRQGPALALLVSLLLGIQSLVLFDSMSVVQDLDPCSSRVAGAYERLSYVETGSTHSGYYENFTVLAQFIVLQSLRSFRGLRLSDTKFTSLPSKRKFHREEKLRRVDKLISWPTNLNTCQTKSTITKLKLDSCALRTGSVHRILSSIQGLEEFSYTCNWPEGTKAFKYSEWGGRGHWEPPKIAKILLETAMTTLVSLDLTNIGEYCAQRGADYSLGSLRDFYKLKYVRVEYMMFVQDAPHDRWSTRVRSLLSVMPESLQYLSLAGPIFPADDASAVLDFLARRKKWILVGEDGEREEEPEFDEDGEDGEHAEGENRKKKKKKKKKHGDQRSKKNDGKKGMSLQNLAKRLHGREKKGNSRETMDSKKEKGRKGKGKKTEKEARRKQRELEEGEEQRLKRLQKEETDALMMEQRGFIPVLMSWQLGVPHLKEIIFEDFYGEGTLRDLLRPFRKGAEKRKIRLCEARLATRPPLRVDDRAGVDDGEVGDKEIIRYEHEPMLVNVVNNLGGHSYHAWAEVWKSSDPSMPTALVTELFPNSHPIVSSTPSHVASSTIPPDIYPSLSSVPKVLLRAPPEESTYPPDATAPATASVIDLRRSTGSSAHVTDADSSITDTDSPPPVSPSSHLDVPRHLLARSHKWKKTAEGYPASPAPSDCLSFARSLAAAARSTTHSSSSMQLVAPMAHSSLTPESNTPISMQMERITDSSRPSTSSTLPPFPPPPPLDAEDDFKNPVEEYIPPEDKCDGLLSDDEVEDFDDDDDDGEEEDGEEEDIESS